MMMRSVSDLIVASYDNVLSFADTCHTDEEKDSALGLATRAIESENEAFQGFLLKALLVLTRGEAAKAMECLEDCLDVCPRLCKVKVAKLVSYVKSEVEYAVCERSERHLRNGDEERNKEIHAAMIVDCKARELLLSGNPRESITLFDDALSSLPEKNKPWTLFYRSQAVFSNGHISSQIPPELRKLGIESNDKLCVVEALHAKYQIPLKMYFYREAVEEALRNVQEGLGLLPQNPLHVEEEKSEFEYLIGKYYLILQFWEQGITHLRLGQSWNGGNKRIRRLLECALEMKPLVFY